MTLSELLHSVPFDDIMPFILQFDGGKQSLAQYKMHYDYLCHLTPTSDGGEIKTATISLIPEEERNEGISRFDGYPLEGDSWEDSLAKELIIEPDVDGSPAEIAACCLWHTSFYGFMDWQRSETFYDLFGELGFRRVKQFKEKYGRQMHIPTKREMCRIPSFRTKIRKKIRRHRRRRMAKGFWQGVKGLIKCRWRFWKRWHINEEYNKRIGYIADFIDDIVERGENVISTPSLQEMSKLLRANHLKISRWQTFAYDAQKRKDYFKDLVEKYNLLDRQYSSTIVCISSSSHHPITMEEMGLLNLIAEDRAGEHLVCVKKPVG